MKGLKRFDGTDWVDIKPKRFDGTNWVDTHVRRAVGYSDRPVWHITDDNTKILYGYHIDGATGGVTYIPGTDNENYTPAAMRSTTFDRGSWPRDAFFIPKPCMVKYDGTVDYFLDPSDYSKKLDGTASDVADLTYGGNCMMQFQVIYHASITTADDGSVDEYFANYKVDDRFECYCNYDAENNLIPYFYVAAFNGCTYDGKMRSISGLKLTPWPTTAYSASATYNVGDKRNYDGKAWVCIEAITEPEAFDPTKWEQYAFNGQITGQEEINQARANNTTATDEWYTYLVADHDLLTKLATLICKHLNHQTKFGRGITSGGQVTKEAYVTGTLNDKGLFWGVTSNGSNAVKMFGIENFYACVWKRVAGLIGTSTGYAYKLTHGTKDGSTATSFNTNGSGYKTLTRTKAGYGYVTTMHYESDGFWIPATVGTNRYNDYHWLGNGYALFGGYSYDGDFCGSWYVNLNAGVDNRFWSVSSALSCKPRAVASAQSQ